MESISLMDCAYVVSAPFQFSTAGLKNVFNVFDNNGGFLSVI